MIGLEYYCATPYSLLHAQHTLGVVGSNVDNVRHFSLVATPMRMQELQSLTSYELYRWRLRLRLKQCRPVFRLVKQKSRYLCLGSLLGID
jgi:hypothetical protein